MTIYQRLGIGYLHTMQEETRFNQMTDHEIILPRFSQHCQAQSPKFLVNLWHEKYIMRRHRCIIVSKPLTNTINSIASIARYTLTRE